MTTTTTATKTTFTRNDLLELDLPTDVRDVPAPAETAMERGTRIHQTVEQQLKAAETEIVEAHGYGYGARGARNYVRPAGTLNQGSLAAAAARVAALPLLDEAATRLEGIIAAERRATSTTQLANWRIDIDGKLREVVMTPDRGLQFQARAIRIADHAVTQARGYAEGSGPNPNTWLGTIKGSNRVRARTCRNGEREVFSVMGPGSARGYVEFDVDRVLRAASNQLGGMNLRADVKYDEGTTRMTARLIAQAPVDIAAFNGVGRLHQIGVQLRAADNGSLSVQCDGFALRIACMNGNMVRLSNGRARVRHIGDMSRMGEALRLAFEETAGAIPELTNLWQRAAVEHYVDRASGTTLGMQDAFERLVLGGHLPKGGLGVKGAVEAYMSAWRAEDSPTSAMGVVMAAQRAAHETTWKTQYAEDEVNEAAAELLYRPVYTLDAAA